MVNGITRLFGDFTEANLATVLDAAGKEVARRVVLTAETPPAAPAGGTVLVLSGIWLLAKARQQPSNP